jgi:UDP-N-acetylmuramate dehydrogenase
MSLNIQKNVDLASFTTFKIGGKAKFFASVSTKNELIKIIKWAKKKEIPFFVLGGGSNVLISDKGFQGLVIKFKISDFKKQENIFFVESGVSFAKLVTECIKAELTGLEWAAGIPGVIGGAINGNAGAFGKDISSVVEKVELFDVKNLAIREFNNRECEFQYRDSIFKKNPDLIIFSAVFKLQKGNSDEINKLAKEAIKKRIDFHGVGARSAGCIFKNISWDDESVDKDYLTKKLPDLKRYFDFPRFSAGFIIDSLGLKGKRIGDAAISEKHANFIINLGNAKAEHVIMLISLIKERVEHKYGIRLKEEVQLIGF